jgi:hypothetical protein
VDRWREVYQILFPNEDIPSPCKLTTTPSSPSNILTISDYEHEDEVAIFEDYSSRETPRVFLELLESRASTNRLTEETKDELVDMIRECRRFVYRQFRQRETQNTPPPPISVAGFNNTNPILRSNISQDTSVNSIETTTFQTGILRCTDFDPDEFQSIFLDQSTLDWDPFEINNISKSQKQCYCIAPCSCPSSASLKFTAVMDELPRGADLGEEMKRLKQENEELRSLIQAQSSFDL